MRRGTSSCQPSSASRFCLVRVPLHAVRSLRRLAGLTSLRGPIGPARRGLCDSAPIRWIRLTQITVIGWTQDKMGSNYGSFRIRLLDGLKRPHTLPGAVPDRVSTLQRRGPIGPARRGLCGIVLQKSISTQIRQFILYISNNQG